MTSQLVGHDLDSRKHLKDLLEELRKLHCYWLQASISQALAIDNIAYYNPFLIHIEILTGYFQRKLIIVYLLKVH